MHALQVLAWRVQHVCMAGVGGPVLQRALAQAAPPAPNTLYPMPAVVRNGVPSGKYRVKFLVDGQWRLAADWPTENNEIGETNNLLVVS